MKKTVLVVDDQPGTRKLLRNVLEASGYDVIEAEDETAAFSAVRTHRSRIGLALIDVELLGVASGPYLAVGLRTLLEAPMIFMSGHERETLISTHHLQASAAFVQKPFRLQEMLQAIAASFGERSTLSPSRCH